MSKRKIPLVEGEFYHVYNRGNSKQKIYFDDQDKDRFIKLLYLCNSKKPFNFRDDIIDKNIDAWDFDRGETIVAIGAWVLMPNHFHIYITIPPLDRDKGREKKQSMISLYMEKLGKAYAQYFNAKYQRTGSLFEGRFKSVHVKSDPQAKYNFSYIHLNPVKLIDKNWKEKGIKDFKKARKFLENYKRSSYLDYKGVVRLENKILNKEVFPEYFRNVKNFDAEINEWLKFGEEN
jgi:putative transposase